MEFIIVFLMILIISASLTMILRRRIEQTIPISVISIILIIYVFGIFECLDIGIYVVELLLLISFVYSIVKIISAIKKRKEKEIIERIFTPGLVIYFVLYIVFIIVNHQAIFTHHDEFSHWGIMIKNTYIYKSININENSLIEFSEYPPFTAIFQYFFLFLKGEYSEPTIFIANNILYLSIIISVVSKIEWKKNLKMIILYLPCILFLPLVCYIDFYNNILVDGLLGVFVFYVLYTWYTEKDNKMKMLSSILGICALSLIKLSGIALGAMMIVIIIGDMLRKKTRAKEFIKKTMIIITIFVLFAISWQVKIRMTKAKMQWNLDNVNTNSIVNISNNQREMEIVENYINGIYETSITSEKKITTLIFMIIIVLYTIFTIVRIKENEEKKKYRYFSIMLMILLVMYIIGLLITYLFIIPKSEAAFIPCYDRYIGSIILPMILFHIMIFLQKNEDMKITKILIITVIMFVLILPTKSIVKKTINWESDNIKNLQERKEYEGILKYKNVFTEECRIYYVGTGTGKTYNAKLTDRYLSLPAKILNEEIYTTGRINLFTEILEKGKYTHIYIYKVTDSYRKRYSSLFENNEVKNETLYHIDPDGIFREVDI